MKNIGKTDKIIRYILAVGLLSLFFILKGDLRYIALIGFIPLVTATFGVCPLYIPFGINTIKEDKQNLGPGQRVIERRVNRQTGGKLFLGACMGTLLEKIRVL